MNNSCEHRVIRRAKMTERLYGYDPDAIKPLALQKPTDLRFYGAVIYGLSAAVLVCLSNSRLLWSFLAPSAIGMIIGVGLVAADQFSLRRKLERVYKFVAGQSI